MPSLLVLTIFVVVAVATAALNKKGLVQKLQEVSRSGDSKEMQRALDTAIADLEAQELSDEAEEEAKLKVYAPVDTSAPGYKLPIVYVFTVSAVFCEYGLPDYIKHSLIQSVMSQHDAEVILVGNYQECPKLKQHTDLLSGVRQIDIFSLASRRMKLFHAHSSDMFQDDGAGNLWVTSALRFFLLEDMMLKHHMTEVMHIEADNMLYGRYTDLLDVFRKGYAKLCAQPLNSNKTFMTASVLWIKDLHAIRHFNDFLLAVATNKMKYFKDRNVPKFQLDSLEKIREKDEYPDSKGKEKGLWDLYLSWLRPYSCCKYGGVKQDEKGMGIRPFAINEMSLMAFYHELYPANFQLLPVIPNYPYQLNRHISNITEFSPAGRESGPDTKGGIWDPNSWGQYLGGTSSKNGRDKGFTDSSHIAGIAIRIAQCKPHMICGKRGIHMLPENRRVIGNGTLPALECYTAPHVRCGNFDEESDEDKKGSQWTPLWNLHVHSKHTENYVSEPCECVR